MTHLRLDLNDLMPLWQRKLPHLLDEAVLHGPDRRDVDLAVTAGRKDVLRNLAPLTQDVIGAIIIRQRRIQR